ncbi:exosome non-catalytic core subunit rrp40 [Agyrium rufum]|nr:exosome non-catalytic core subunit rrp40 [Agyrium rufum]
MASQIFLLPGEEVPSELLPATSGTSALKLGPGLRHVPPSSIVATVAGSLSVDKKKKAVWMENNTGRLPHLAFEGVSKKTRPQLAPGSLIYAKVASASKFLDTELVCYNPATGKSEGMGELKGGMVFDVSLGMARRLLMSKQKEDGGLLILEAIAESLPFEVAVGRNGRVWVNSAGVMEIYIIGKAIQETDEKMLDLAEQKKLVQRLLKTI